MESHNQGAHPAQGWAVQPEPTGLGQSGAHEILREARDELSRLDRAQLVELTAALLESMPSSYQWSVVASIRRERRRRLPACQPRMQSP